ncbi:MAG: hypothetical protein KF729_31060 [Sandaracinaceae bacterium]|nr:hypothetical protein [Sandaracinaceae bacterium]
MSALANWWDRRSTGEKIALGVAGGVLTVATAGAVGYAIATGGGAAVVIGEVMVAVGPAAVAAARARR